MDKIVASYGCLEITRYARGYYVAYAGSMTTTEDDVRKCFEGLYGEGAWAKLQTVARDWTLDGLDYAWFVTVPSKTFEKTFLTA